MTESAEQNAETSGAFSLNAFFRIIWETRLLILLIILLFIGIGLVIAFTSQEEFTSEGRILPEIQSKGSGLGQFAGLASLAGFDLNSMGSGMDAIRPDLYPDVLVSTQFYLDLLKSKVRTRENKEMTFEQFYHVVIEKNKDFDEFKKTFPVKEEGIVILSRLGETRIRGLKKRITASISRKSGIITINAKMPDPVVAAGVTKFAMDYLTNYVTIYRTEKLRREVDFLAERVANSRGKFYNNQEKKALYSDQFQASTIRLQSADVQRERIESEYKISSTFYNELLKKYEEAKIKLQQETPVFKILDLPVASTFKTEPKRAVIVLMATFLGFFSAVIAALLWKKNYKNIFINS